MGRRPQFQSQTTAIVVGAVFFTVGCLCLYDAWERRGQRTPWPARMFTPW